MTRVNWIVLVGCTLGWGGILQAESPPQKTSSGKKLSGSSNPDHSPSKKGICSKIAQKAGQALDLAVASSTKITEAAKNASVLTGVARDIKILTKS